METQRLKDESTLVKISIVVPVYNDEEYLATCLDSLVNQTLKEIEILLVNDGSTDGSLAILNEYAARDSRIRVFSFPENRSPFVARNEGIRNASGEYIMFVDADDYLELNACERVWELEQERPVDILNFNSNIINVGTGSAGQVAYQRSVPNEYLKDADIFKVFINGAINVLLWNKCFRRELCLRVVHECGDIFLPKGEDELFLWIATFFARSFWGCPSVTLYNHCYGLGVEGSKKDQDIELFELFLKSSWPLNEIERFNLENMKNWEAEEALRRKRCYFIYRCVSFWRDMASQDQPEALRLLLRYWSKTGDLGRIVGAFSRVFGARQGELADLLAPILREKEILAHPVQRKPIRTVGTYYQSYSNGGVQRVLSLTLPIWIRLGYRVVFLTDEENENDYPLPEGVIRVNCTVSNSDGAKDYSERGEDWENLLRKHEIDVMVYHNVYGGSQLWETLLCRLMGIPILTFYHADLPYLLNNPNFLPLIPGVGRLSDGVITLNKMDRTFWHGVAPETTVFQVKNPLTFSPADVQPCDLDGPPTILWAARLHLGRKRYLDPVETMAEVVKRVPDVKLYMVGSGESNLEMNALNSRIAELGLEESVIPCGFQTDMASWYRKASVFLLTSSSESFCLGLAEALTFGIPVVMYEIPFLTLVQGNAGIVAVPQLDITAAADAICELLENREYRQEAGRRGREFIENLYAGDEIAEQWQHIFDSVGEPDSTPKESEAYGEIVQLFLKKYKQQLSVPSGKSDPASSGLVRFRYGDAAKQQYAELRSSGPQDKLEVSLVLENGQKRFHHLLKSDGNRNWVTPEELKTLTEHSNAPEAKVADLTKQIKELQAGRDTLAEVRKALTGQTGGEWPCIRFTYGDTAKQQYTELRTSGPQDDREVSLVSIQEDGKKRFNILLNSDGNRNWVTPEELKRFTERSGASETALEAKIAELTGKLERLGVLYDSLAEKRKVRPKRQRRKMYRWKNR